MITVRTDAKTKKGLIAVGKLTKDVRAALQSGFEELGANLVRTGEKQALELKYGREYKRKGGVIHKASKAGQSPAFDTGRYSQEGFGYEARSNEMEFGNTADYAGYLEDGTDKMKPRPGVLNAVNENTRNVRTYLDHGIQKVLNLES